MWSFPTSHGGGEVAPVPASEVNSHIRRVTKLDEFLPCYLHLAYHRVGRKMPTVYRPGVGQQEKRYRKLFELLHAPPSGCLKRLWYG